MPIERNGLESARFGIEAARLVDPVASLAEVNAAAAAQGVRMITARVDSGALDRVHALEADGYRLMDTLVYYARPLDALPELRPLPDGLVARDAGPADAGAVAAVAEEAFAGYFGHYHADPRLDRAAADAAYVQWAETSVAQSSATAPVLLIGDKHRIVAFAALRCNSEAEFEGVLYAVHPSARRGGLYGQLVARSLHHGHALGRQRMIVSTQINNIAVQKVWARHGFVMDRSLYTFHKWFDGQSAGRA